jgi:uncharacterized protein
MVQLHESIPTILDECRTIAVVGLSSRPDRPSYGVARYMQARGYRIVPVNPTYAGTHILGEHCYATLTQAARALSETGAKIELVDCFRRSEHIGEVVDEAIAIGARCVWMQLGVVNEAAADKARAAGLAVIEDKCIKIEHMQFM